MTTDDGIKINQPLTYPASLASDLSVMLEAASDRHYYQFTLGADEDGSLYSSAFTGWAGWTDDTMRYELREPSLVMGQQAFDQLVHLGQPALFVEGAQQFAVWNILGGHGLVEASTAEEFLVDQLLPSPSAIAPEGSGFVGLQGRPGQELRYAPTPKLRLQVLKRDMYRCRVCGRGPGTNTDLELHVHHVRPWGTGGLTHELNLLTLCSTCHRGLPARHGRDHYERSFHSLVPGAATIDRPSKAAIAYRDSVIRYRDKVEHLVERSF
ncbi:HNH endonuclease signature motif containing protein [Winogradskya humida]|uniref:HNH nuclease domain-containing protein n=1 Tax=Winogradskya humida TaxID=113566 RepID=A0ABQ4A038_9ACTN|nr:HNH endonuclease signature motif containing protein [Actinoplanes humidus]GIE24231.1 hypothetical protein Ahu01nite_073330 [Actinoplanes humidus]